MKKIFSVAFVAFIFSSNFFLVHSKDNVDTHSKEYDGIVAVVNDDVITSQDLESRVRMTLFSIGGNASPDLKAKISQEVLREMVHDILKWQCTEKFAPKGGWISNEGVQTAFSEIAHRNNMDVKDFCKLLDSKKIDKNILLRQLQVNLSWMEYIKARFGKFINISESEMNRTVTEIKEKINKESYYIYRMFFPVAETKDENNVASHVNNLVQMLHRGADFASLARQFSKGADASKGGEVGWVFQGQLSPEENLAASKMSIGSYVVVRNSRGYVILLLKDKKEAGLRAFTELRFVQVVVPFSEHNPGNDEIQKLKNYAIEMKNSSKNCRELIAKAKDSGFCGVSEPINVVLEGMQPHLRPIVSSIPAGGMGNPVVTPNGIVVICMLDRKAQTVKEPTREEIKSQKMSERLSVFADRELRDLSKKADIIYSENSALKSE